jgi:2-keto-4-pentenoate hydratase/2-oxohepta-3-ene-1,7-dioic acid hydratase in catechol pathway
MKLLTFIQDNEYRLGIKLERGIVDVNAASVHSSLLAVPRSVDEVIERGQAGLLVLHELVDQVLKGELAAADYWVEESTLAFGPCVTRPHKIICVGLNYRKHAEETNLPIPEYPILFNKFANTLTGHGQPIALPRSSKKVDYEAELTIVMGKQAKNVTRESALDYVIGYCNANDLSARDLQTRTTQWMLGKTCDGFSPLGPYLVTADEVGNPNNLEIKAFLNGELRQHSHTSDMIFSCDEIVSYISQHFTLEPGDIILTGTPEGVIMGHPPEKQLYMQAGDVITIEIEGLGSLTNRMVADV